MQKSPILATGSLLNSIEPWIEFFYKSKWHNSVYHKMASKQPQMNKLQCDILDWINQISLQIKVKIREAWTKSTQSCIDNSWKDFCNSLCF